MPKSLISIFTPVYNEEDNIQIIWSSVKNIMESVSDKFDYEHVFSDNKSNDNTLKMLGKICSHDLHVKVISLSRNFGVTKSTLNGLQRCSGDAVIQIDADMQDPPNMILEFIKKWEDGFKVVYGIRQDRDEKVVMKLVRKYFYCIAETISNETLIPDVGEFRLMDRRILSEIEKIKDFNPYLRGIVANLGFKQIGIPYHRDKRFKGKTSTNLYHLFDYGINGIISHSTILLRLSTIFGMTMAFISFLLIIVYSLLKIIYQQSPSGLTSLYIFILFFSGIQMIFLGIIGEYISKIYTQSIHKPLVIEEELINFE
ncbi:MAG: glycosyltransferase family 2 protein [Candidatus Marinimicrobia bacterium]|jgi:dolichol-phosphate mannosyltransferase|nr:glycosyltransferase family 2 protein [Candidatus Neomarinimicrobiota bacterium]MBT3633485.1 glycosyltransferase family 2 protein [Candidatus Neomarinimicrobiota bacterium]MBT3681627.1 glycosyltransferase family 2 protein [Candidatus Neomarinimicrobiota bacterium]MBT3758405.1 glycosyltransferase family 2 protein [Candidatus Neomarinimicrobiota bacterium]MBT3894941.1 glycosyltransferase family 2 protein [Candidatus Neomarinimicrobiota bacterium]